MKSDSKSQQADHNNIIRSVKIRCPDIGNIFNITEEEIKKSPNY